ncbi:MAG: LysR family transcriptional regulator [Actinobacteria bacterium]|nr:LysR family transcriptional regulator [Actinomycetota bacterium]
MNLRRLTYLLAVAEEGGIRAASRKLHIAQPSVSQGIRLLEGDLGVRLVVSTPAGTELTPEGAELIQHARQIIDRVDAARKAVRRVAAQPGDRLQIGLVSGVVSAGELLTPVMDAYRELRPDLTIRFSEVSFADQVTPLVDGQVDVMLVRGPIDVGPLADPRLVVSPIAEEPRALIVGAFHEIAGAQSIDVDEVLGYPTLPLAAADDWSDFWQLDGLRGGSNVDRTVDPVETVPEVQLAIATHGLVVSTPGTVGRLQPNPLTRTIELRGAPLAVIAVARRRDDSRWAVKEFVDTAERAARRNIGLMPGAVSP